MNTIIIVILIAVVILLFWFCLSPDNQEKFDDSPVKIINFNTSWCGASKHFQPAWDKFTEMMKGKNIEVIDMKCDKSKDNDAFCDKNGIQGYPTVKLIKGSQSYEYQGNRTPDDLIQFCKKYVSNL